MPYESVIVWTASQRRGVIEFMRQYANQLEKEMDDADSDYGLRGAQSGVLHLFDKLIPPGVEYIANSGPKQPIREGVKVLLTDGEVQTYENEKQGKD